VAVAGKTQRRQVIMRNPADVLSPGWRAYAQHEPKSPSMLQALDYLDSLSDIALSISPLYLNRQAVPEPEIVLICNLHGWSNRYFVQMSVS
jgi:hypothetical protein